MQYTQNKQCLLAVFSFFLFSSFIDTSANATENKYNLLKNKQIYPENQKLYDLYPWSVLYYYGISASDPFFRILQGEFHRWPEHVQSFELEYTLSEQNPVRRFFNPLVGIVQIAGNFAIRNGSQQPTIYEFDPYIAFRWANFPWNHYINTSFALGEGISYTSSVPALESKNNNTNTKRLLNYMLVEATFASPSYPRLQLALRVHHRSGAYGLYHAGNTGSNNIGLGIRYLFD